MRRRGLILSAALPALALAAPPPLRVVASFSILADLIRAIGGPVVAVSSLVGPDADAHVYQPSPADARRLADAQLMVVNGLGFEGWLDRLVQASGFRGTLLTASVGIQPRRLGREPDPHAWQDLGMVQRYVKTLTAALIDMRLDDQQALRARADAYLGQLQSMDAALRKRLDRLSREQRRVVTSHDAFGYFGDAYGVDFLSAQGMSTNSEPSASAVARLIQQIRRQQVRAVFVENISDPRLIERIAREGGVRVGGRLYSDALSGPSGPAATFLQLFAHNAEAICTALGV
ncbi:zinc ABC transporter substrate-binding protein [Roseateles sp. SL47]|uniref:metal ABC transporter solute-binding protein, Zn/Mn family n=1 Tax=Roseateles sp. SL47 TaxID=2995138 RepID=UPI00226FA699|nr:zinc ABC transporter substrate-binding protein [Roseateles sp. SL47]WAC75719.1 zinc ABC transporter substrate-binding protein [Roseateles sp. SL47]